MSADVLQGKRMLVVGASSGIGAATAAALLRRGGRVVVSARRADRLEALASEHETALAVAADIVEPAECDRLVYETIEFLGGLDVLVYCAGTGTNARIADTDPEAWQRDHAVNVIGSNLITGRVLPHLDSDGLSMFISSRGVEDRHWGLSSYHSSKAALDGTMHAWRVEHPDRRFLRVQMGNTMDTEFGDHLDPDLAEEAMTNWARQGIDLGLMEVGDVAAALADVIATALAHPGLDIREYQLDGRPL